MCKKESAFEIKAKLTELVFFFSSNANPAVYDITWTGTDMKGN